jgi:hypothetical protein
LAKGEREAMEIKFNLAHGDSGDNMGGGKDLISAKNQLIQHQHSSINWEKTNKINLPQSLHFFSISKTFPFFR